MRTIGTDLMRQFMPGGLFNNRRYFGAAGSALPGGMFPGMPTGYARGGGPGGFFANTGIEDRRQVAAANRAARRSLAGAQQEAGRIQPEDYTSSSYSGLSPWAESALSGMVGRLSPGMMKGYQQSLRDLDKNPELIEQKRQELNTQFARDIQAPTMNAVRNATASAAGRGVLGGTSYNDQVGQISQGANAAAAQQQSASNVWAADALMKNILDKVAARQAGMGMMGDFAGMGRYSTSTDPTAWMRLGGFTGPQKGGGFFSSLGIR